jgi:alanine dehydrogenase
MKEIGFVKTSMPEEARVALLPPDIEASVSQPEKLFFETGYATHLDVTDADYEAVGARIVPRIDAYSRDVLCIPKPWISDIDYFREGQTIMGWIYLPERKEMARAVLKHKMTAIAWENMYGPNKEYVFEKNRWMAGYIAVTQALPFAKASPKKLRIGVLGNGRVAQGAFDRLKEEGVTSYEVFGTNLIEDLENATQADFDRVLATFKKRIGDFDVVVNCWYYNPAFGNYITLADLQEMRAGSLFIDVASDGVEASIPHTDITPFYRLGRFNPIIVWNNNHAPSYWPLDASEVISKGFAPYADMIIKEESDYVLDHATVVKDGEIIDERISALLAK